MRWWWTRRSLKPWSLLPLALLYRTLTALHAALYRWRVLRREQVAAPVLVVGNLVAGGGGKTPLVLALAQHLSTRGLRAGIISRGYGRESNEAMPVLADTPVELAGDEALLLAQKTALPVFVARRRAQAAQALLAQHPQTQLLISDDGLQHHALASDAQICTWDKRGVGNGWLLPAGPLRAARARVTWNLSAAELSAAARSQCLRRVDVQQGSYLVQRALSAQLKRADGQTLALSALRGQAVCALAGIANPQGFFELLAAQGVALARTVELPDHYAFDSNSGLMDLPKPLICTEKDAAKLWRWRPDAWSAALEIEIEPEFWSELDAWLSLETAVDL